ncbi:hypothetical protein GCM10023107_03050 [Actinoplanes octamycinicus]|nr:hypothetical protein Aoc01nite_69930 [Actinoplanes octamycinicus]
MKWDARNRRRRETEPAGKSGESRTIDGVKREPAGGWSSGRARSGAEGEVREPEANGSGNGGRAAADQAWK